MTVLRNVRIPDIDSDVSGETVDIEFADLITAFRSNAGLTTIVDLGAHPDSLVEGACADFLPVDGDRLA